MAPKAKRVAAAKKPVEIVPESPKEEVVDVPMMETPSPVTVAEVEIKVPDAPKKRARKPKNDDNEAPKEKTPEPKNDEEVKVDAPKKRSRKPKNSDDEANDKPKKERKPRTKKVVEDKNTDDKPKKERKPRAKTEYNIFIGDKMKELREKHKDDAEKLKTTEYMKMAIAEWKLHKEAKANA
jgi:hypothetical protein